MLWCPVRARARVCVARSLAFARLCLRDPLVRRIFGFALSFARSIEPREPRPFESVETKKRNPGAGADKPNSKGDDTTRSAGHSGLSDGGATSTFPKERTFPPTQGGPHAPLVGSRQSSSAVDADDPLVAILLLDDVIRLRLPPGPGCDLVAGDLVLLVVAVDMVAVRPAKAKRRQEDRRGAH